MPARSHGKSGTKPYMIWINMMQRCHNPNNPQYAAYGGRGIDVCADWRNFAIFYAAMGDPPKGMELERVDNNKGYHPGNVVWATRKQQVRNTRQNRLLTYSGKTQCLSDWSAEIGISRDALSARLQDGWSVERTLTEPSMRGRRHTEEAKAKMRKPKRRYVDPVIRIT